MDKLSVISILVSELIRARPADSKFVIYAPDKSKAVIDHVSGIEFINEFFNTPLVKNRKHNVDSLNMHTMGSQILELYMQYDKQLYDRVDTRSPYNKVSASDILASRNYVPIFDIIRRVSDKDVPGSTAFKEKYSGYLRNIRDSYLHGKILTDIDDYRTNIAMYRRHMETFYSTNNIVPIDITRTSSSCHNHVIFMDESGNYYIRHKIFDPGYLIHTDYSQSSNLIGIESEIRTINAGKRVQIFTYPLYNLSGIMALNSKTSVTKKYKLPRDTNKLKRDLQNDSVGIALFEYPEEKFNADASIRTIMNMGLDPVPDHICSWSNYVFCYPENLILNRETLREDVSEVIKKNFKRITGKKYNIPDENSELILPRTESAFDLPFDDLVLETFYWEISQKNTEKRELNIERLKNIAARLIDGKYYSRITGNELEFLNTLYDTQDDLEGMEFDTETRLLQDNFSEFDYISMGTIFDDKINDIIAITGSWDTLDKTYKNVFADELKHSPPDILPERSIYEFAKTKYPLLAGNKITPGITFNIPGKESDDIETKILNIEDVSLPESDMTGVSDILKKYVDNNRINWHTLISADTSFQNTRDIKDRINKIIGKYKAITKTELDRELIARSGVSDITVSVAIFKIGILDNRFASMPERQAQSEEMRECFKFATAFRQELAVAQHHEFVPIHSDRFEQLSDMHKRTMIARNNSQLKTVNLQTIFNKLDTKGIPSVSSLSDAYPTNIFVSNREYIKILKTGTGFALTVVLGILEEIYNSITHKNSGMREQAQILVLSLVESVFINVLAEEMAIRVFTDIDGPGTRWVFQELFTENKFRTGIIETPENEDDDDNIFSNAGVNFLDLVSDEQDMDDVLDTVFELDDMARDISMMISEWDDLDY